MKKYIIPFMAFVLVTSSCSDWLDVRGENVQKEQGQFDTYKGFRDALTGCYMNMASLDAYGQRLTMTNVEDMADLWFMEDGYKENAPVRYQFHHHDYSGDQARSAIKAIYGQLFTTVASVNVLLKNIHEKGSNIQNQQARAVIEGECYAIRAFCQLDVLRLFGQMPEGGARQVSLPYSYTTSIDEMPSYYSFGDYVDNLRADLEKAERLLRENDPVMTSSYSNLNNSSDVQDDFLYFRQSRMNYWAVRALRARLDLYVGNTAEAHDTAMELIQAKNVDGSQVVTLSSINDFTKGFNALPSECLFYLSKYDVNTYANSLLIGGNNTKASSSSYVVSNDMLNELYASIPGSTASHNHYLSLWNRAVKNSTNTTMPALKKYWYDSGSAEASQYLTKYQIIPMLRLSEVYLIAMETSHSLDEVKSLYSTYMTDRQYVLYTPFESLDAARKEMVNEYRREFFGEGQMFFVYKRTAASRMMWNSDVVDEQEYVLPLPSSEYDPSTPNK